MNLCLPAEMSSDIIKVCVRCRPMSPRERAFTARSVVEAGHSAGEVSGKKKNGPGRLTSFFFTFSALIRLLK